MFRLTKLFILLPALFALSCNVTPKTEQQEETYWKTQFADSAYQLLYNTKDTTAALLYLDAASRASGNKTALLKSYRSDIIANYYYFFTDSNAATAQHIDAALAAFNSTEMQNRYPRTNVRLLLFGGDIAYRLTQYNKANEYYFKAKKLGDAHLGPCERKAFNYSIAMVLYRQENYLQSLQYFQEAYRLQATCTPQKSAVVLQQQEIQSNIGLCYFNLKQYDSANIHFYNALRIADQYRDSLGTKTMETIYGVVYSNKAMVAMAQAKLGEARSLFLKSIALIDRKGYDVEYAMSSKLNLAEVYCRQHSLPSMSALLFGLRDSIREFNPRIKLDWNRHIASYYEQIGRPDSALYFFKQAALLKDSMNKAQKELTAADVAHQLTEKEQDLEIAVLKKDKQLTVASLWVTIIIVAMTLAIITLIYQHYRRSKKNLAESLALNEEIERQKEAREAEARLQHKRITEAVIHAQESERSLIGLELHDNINQVLTTVKLLNEMVLEGVGDANFLLPKSLVHLQNCINEIRSLSRRLSAPTLGKISLEESVKDLIDSISLAGNVKITRQFCGLQNAALKQDLHLGVYRILQEQLNNVLKHADASEVIVRLERANDRLLLYVADNGKGFAVQNSRSGIGLMNMQTRAENLNGSLELKSKPGKGCKLKVTLPCEQ